MYDDLWLIFRCQRGEPDAFSALYNHYRSKVFRTACYLVRNRSMAEDITQEVFISVFQNIRDLKNPSAFRTWLYRVAVSKASHLLRDEKNTLFNMQLDESLECDSPACDPLGETLNQAEIAALRGEIRKLPDELRLPVLLYYYSGLRVKEIAGVLGIPPGTVKSRLHTARTKLASVLEPAIIDIPGKIKEVNL